MKGKIYKLHQPTIILKKKEEEKQSNGSLIHSLQEENQNLVKKNKTLVEVLMLKYSPKIKSKKDRKMK